MSLYRVEQELEDRTTLLGASGDHGPDPFAPVTALLAARPLGNVCPSGKREKSLEAAWPWSAMAEAWR